MVEKNKGFQVGAHIVMIILSLCCIFPFLLLIVSSITDEQELIRNGYAVPEGTQSECLPVHV